jgi:hypothetical protein
MVQELQSRLDEQAAWAQGLNAEVAVRDGIIGDLQRQLQEQAAWAQQLDAELHTVPAAAIVPVAGPPTRRTLDRLRRALGALARRRQ